MIGPTSNEQVQYVMVNVRAAKGMAGVPRDYDVLFTDNGIVFANIGGGLKSILKTSVGAQFGMVGALAARGSTDKEKQKGRAGLRDLSVKQILETSEKSFYICYTDVQTVTLKKGLTGIGKMSFLTADGKYLCEFPKDQLEVARTAISERLSMKMEA
jgi:hypothetical protein